MCKLNAKSRAKFASVNAPLDAHATEHYLKGKVQYSWPPH